jgi:ABC-type bacteriocin/lantibiotic exporter with double-glycine peptidase domain
VIFNSQIELASKLATGERFLNARTQDLQQRDVGSWRLTFSVASAFLGSLESLVVSIPLAIFSLLVNLIVMGAYTDSQAIGHLLLICMVPSLVSLGITYASSNVAIRMMGQQSQLESIIYSVVKNIRGIWMTNSASYFEGRFAAARTNMAQSLLKSGTIAATTDVLDKITTGLLYTYIYIEYYRSSTTASSTQLSVGSLLVIYSAIGIVSGALNSITHDMVSIFQTLPTYWTPNAIRDINTFVSPIQGDLVIKSLVLDNLTYLAPGLNGPFKQPLSLEISSPGSLAIMGPSGSGKSTLLKLLLGHLKPTTGRLELIDAFGNNAAVDLYQANVLVISQDLRLFGDHLRDVVDPAGSYSDSALEDAAATMGLSEVLDQLPLRWLTPINEFSRDLSLGQLQLFKLTKVLLKPHKIIITDEPTCHLPEPLHMHALQLLNEHCDLHISVLHRQSGMALFDRILELNGDGEAKLIRRAT